MVTIPINYGPNQSGIRLDFEFQLRNTTHIYTIIEQIKTLPIFLFLLENKTIILELKTKHIFVETS